MDNRRGGGAPPDDRQPRKPLNQNRNFTRRDGENSAKRFQPRGEQRFQNTDEKFQPRDEKSQTSNRFAPKGRNFKLQWERDEKPLPRIVSEMQITDGKHRGKFIEATASAKVRPTTRRIREVMFRILHRRVRAGRFLDLCAGSGMVGLEAVSRGALLCTFVERSAKMCSVIKRNMETCGVKNGHGEVVCAEAAPFLKQMLKRRRAWDVVYFDPPYDADYDEILKFFARGAALKTRGVLVIEHHAEMFFPENFGAMSRWRVLVQGETALSFYEKIAVGNQQSAVS